MSTEKSVRLMSLDAYRGFVMLLMASSGLALTRISGDDRVMTQFDGTAWAGTWRTLWDTLGYQLSHVAWTGCSAWDLIQPSFMFMVGVSLPFSMARRDAEGTAGWRSFLHAVWRSFVLVGLGVALSSKIDNGIMSFTFANVLCQIGLGYSFLYLLRGLSLKGLTASATIVLVGYGAWFALQPIDQAEVDLTKQYLTERADEPSLAELDWSQFREGSWAAHWNKHTNAAAQVDRNLLNQFPRVEEPWKGKGFWANRGGYQTLNFIPSLATMIFGLMAGLVLRSDRDDGARLKWLFCAGLACLGIGMAADSTLWPTQWLPVGLQQQLYEYSWSVCPAVKRIWSPTWAVFAAGWTFWMLGFFYWLVDVMGCRRIVTPFAIVGLNSIAMYCMAQLFKGWIGGAMRTVAETVDRIGGWSDGLGWWLSADTFAYAPVLDYSLRLFAMWCVCYWMYRRGLYIRI
jgi:heparan-alpha-glucosaminide N-acetyltransferase